MLKKRCYSDSLPRKGRERASKGVCPYLCATCAGSMRKCDSCGLSYCAYHFPRHLVLEDREDSDFDPTIDKWVSEKTKSS